MGHKTPEYQPGPPRSRCGATRTRCPASFSGRGTCSTGSWPSARARRRRGRETRVIPSGFPGTSRVAPQRRLRVVRDPLETVVWVTPAPRVRIPAPPSQRLRRSARARRSWPTWASPRTGRPTAVPGAPLARVRARCTSVRPAAASARTTGTTPERGRQRRRIRQRPDREGREQHRERRHPDRPCAHQRRPLRRERDRHGHAQVAPWVSRDGHRVRRFIVPPW
jgi:hypothetical protein